MADGYARFARTEWRSGKIIMTGLAYTKWLGLLAWARQHPDKRAALVAPHGAYIVQYVPTKADGSVFRAEHDTRVDVDPFDLGV